MAKPNFLYLLFHATDPLFKIGTALDVWVRIPQLPDEINIGRSRCIEFPEGPFAVRVEKLLHAFFMAHNKPRPHKGSGYTEWYDQAVFLDVIAFIERNQEMLRCGTIRELPAREQKHVKMPGIPLDPKQRAEERRIRIALESAKYVEDNRKIAGRFLNWLETLKDEKIVVGWFGNALVLWFEGVDLEKKYKLVERPLFVDRSGIHPLIGPMRFVNGLFLVDFVVAPPELVGYFARFGIQETQPIHDSLFGIPVVPSGCVQDLELLTQMNFFDIVKANERECEEWFNLQNKIVSRILANIVDDRRPVPDFQQLAFA